MKRLLCLIPCVACCAEVPVWSPSYQMKFRAVADVIPSPDGKWAAWTERHSVMTAEKSEAITHIFLGSADGSKRVQLTRGEKSSGAPRFSPDGAWVFFTSDRSGKSNVYRIPVAGGEAEQLTDWKGPLVRYELSPDAKQIALVAAEEDKDAEKRKKEKLDFNVVGDRPVRHALWLFALDGDIPATPRKLVSGDFHVAGLDWSPDSSRIAFQRVPRLDADVVRHADIAEVEVSGGTVRELAATPDTEMSPAYSPDGRWLVFLRQPSRNQVATAVRMVLLNRADGTTREMPPTADERPSIVGWSGDSRSILFSEVSRCRGVLYRMPIDGQPSTAREAVSATIGDAQVNATGTHVGYAMQSPDDAPEAYVATLAGGAAVRVSAANVGLARPATGRTELVRWKGKDGLDIEGLLTYPVNHRPGSRAPLILYIHGGPSGAFTMGFEGGAGPYPLATFASKGYAVLRPNPRGSTGRGASFRGRVVEDWGGSDFNDIMAGVDHVIGIGVADPDRMAVMGWSYGGYMTAWAVTQTTRFKAAAIGAGITNHVSMYGTQDIPSLFEDYFGGTPWENAAVYARSSPINFVNNVRTPTLIQHGENDARVPPSQAYEFHRALERQKVPVRMVVYPRQGHGVTEPKFQQQVMEEHLAWVEKFLAAK